MVYYRQWFWMQNIPIWFDRWTDHEYPTGQEINHNQSYFISEPLQDYVLFAFGIPISIHLHADAEWDKCLF